MRNFKKLIRNLYDNKSRSINLVEILKLIVETQPKMCFRKMNIKVNENHASEDIHVSAHAMEAFFNIVRNACEAMTDVENRQLDISTVLADGNAVIRISDTGPGIPENILARIFNYGFTTKENGSGTGLGLSISYGIIQEHKGRIEVDSQEGAGTTFTLHIPLLPPDSAN